MQNSQGLTNKKKFHLPTGQVQFFFTCQAEKPACPVFWETMKLDSSANSIYKYTLNFGTFFLSKEWGLICWQMCIS